MLTGTSCKWFRRDLPQNQSKASSGKLFCNKVFELVNTSRSLGLQGYQV